MRSTGGDIDPGPIRDLLREHILQTAAVDLGDMVLGQEVTERRIHSAYSLFIATTLHPKRHRKKACQAWDYPGQLWRPRLQPFGISHCRYKTDLP